MLLVCLPEFGVPQQQRDARATAACDAAPVPRAATVRKGARPGGGGHLARCYDWSSAMRCAISVPYCSMETSLMEEKY